jgi:hypothetical protein
MLCSNNGLHHADLGNRKGGKPDGNLTERAICVSVSKKTSNEGWVGENCMEGGEPIYRTGEAGSGRGPGFGPGRRSFSISRILSPFFYNCFFLFLSLTLWDSAHYE